MRIQRKRDQHEFIDNDRRSTVSRFSRTLSNSIRRELSWVGWFISDAFLTARKTFTLAIVAEVMALALQLAAMLFVAKMITSSEDQLLSLPSATAGLLIASITGGLLLLAEATKYVALRAKHRLTNQYEVSAIQRVLRYAHGANRYDAETVKELSSRLPQVSARVATAAMGSLAPAVVGLAAVGYVILEHPGFAGVLAASQLLLLPFYIVVLQRGRNATRFFYSRTGLDYIRNLSVLLRGNGHREELPTLISDARRSLTAMEERRATPNLVSLVTGGGLSITVGILVGYGIISGRNETKSPEELLQLFFVLRFALTGFGGLSGAISKTQILMPRIEAVMWALQGESPSNIGFEADKTFQVEIEDDIDE